MWLHIKYKNCVKRYGKFLQWPLCMCKCLAGLYLYHDKCDKIIGLTFHTKSLEFFICPVPLSVQLSIPLFHKFLVVSVDKFCSLCMKMSRISQYWKITQKNCMLLHDLSCKYNHGGRLITAIKSFIIRCFLWRNILAIAYPSKIFSKRCHTIFYTTSLYGYILYM